MQRQCSGTWSIHLWKNRNRKRRRFLSLKQNQQMKPQMQQKKKQKLLLKRKKRLYQSRYKQTKRQRYNRKAQHRKKHSPVHRNPHQQKQMRLLRKRKITHPRKTRRMLLRPQKRQIPVTLRRTCMQRLAPISLAMRHRLRRMKPLTFRWKRSTRF